jgi:hypothetical protein
MSRPSGISEGGGSLTEIQILLEMSRPSGISDGGGEGGGRVARGGPVPVGNTVGGVGYSFLF